jgi:hypothetical protein
MTDSATNHSRGRGLLVALMDVEPEWEAENNRWYDEEHFPERMACPGFRDGHRYVRVEGDGPKYLATYEMDTPEVVHTEEYLRIRPPTEWSLRLQPHRKSVRTIYVDITPEIPAGYIVKAVRPSSV